MDYFGIIKKAYQITVKNKYLWIFGIFAGATGIGLGWNTDAGSWQTDKADLSNLSSKLTSAELAAFWDQYAMLLLTGALITLLLFVALFVLSVISRGALIGSVDKIDKGEKADYRTGFKIGTDKFWHLWGVMIIFALIALGGIIVLAGPVTALVVSQLYPLAIGWGVLFFLLLIILWIVMGVISPYAFQVAVLEKKGLISTIRKALHLVREHLMDVIVMYLLLAATGIVFGMAVALGFMLISAVLLAIGYALWLASAVVAVIYGFMVGLGLLILIVAVSGAYASFTSAVITLTYNRLKKSS